MRILIFGSGGHGWESLIEYINADKNRTTKEFHFCYLPVDWGGFTGDFGRILEKEDRKLNKEIHNNQSIPIYPWGDINKIIAFFIGKKFNPYTRNNFEKRFLVKPENFKYFEDSMLDFLTDIQADSKTKEEAQKYLKVCLKEMVGHTDKSGSISNFWHNYLYSKGQNIFYFNNFYHRNQILPYNLNLNIIGYDRMILKAIDTNGKTVEGEDLIDDHPLPLLPESFKLLDICATNIQDSVLDYFCYKLESSDFIIIPNGSIANWLPLVNQVKIKNILVKKSSEHKLICIMNLFHASNEFQYSDYMGYLYKLEIKPLVLGPRVHHILLNKDLLKAYEKENKTLNNIDSLKVDNYLGCLEVISELQDSRVEGLKYTLESVKKTLELIINN